MWGVLGLHGGKGAHVGPLGAVLGRGGGSRSQLRVLFCSNDLRVLVSAVLGPSERSRLMFRGLEQSGGLYHWGLVAAASSAPSGAAPYWSCGVCQSEVQVQTKHSKDFQQLLAACKAVQLQFMT